MKRYLLSLRLFDGEGGAGTPGAAADTPAEGTASNGISNQEETQVVYGKQEQGETAADSQEQQETKQQQEKAPTLKELLKTSPELKQQFESTIQNRIKNQARASQQLQQKLDQLQPLLDNLYIRYGVKDGDFETLQSKFNQDSSYLQEEADMRGLTVEQLQYEKQLQAQNMQYERQMRLSQEQQYQMQLQQRWTSESAQLQQIYPDFNLAYEVENNPQFKQLILSNVPVKDAYEFSHREEIEAIKQQQAAQAINKQVAQNIQAGKGRPTEAGAKPRPGVTYKSNPADFTSQDIKEIRRRVMAGEQIRF